MKFRGKLLSKVNRPKQQTTSIFTVSHLLKQIKLKGAAKMQDDLNIVEKFWSNVDELRQQKKTTWTALVGGNSSNAANYTANVTLKTVGKIAEVLGVTVAELFEGF